MSTRSSPNSLSHKRKFVITDNNGNETVLEDGSFTEKWIDSVTFGPNVKGWRDNLRRGLSATTSMDGSHVTFRYSPGGGTVRYNQSGGTGMIVGTGNMNIDCSIPSGSPSDVDIAKSDSDALGKFNSRVRERLTSFQGGVFLGELGQTIQTIRNPARGLRRLADGALSDLRRIRRVGLRGVNGGNDLQRLKRVTENLADAWLELQFGWKPLLHDVDDGCKALAQYNTGQSLHTARCTASSEVEANAAVDSVAWSKSQFKWRTTTVTKDRSLVIYRGAVRAEAMDPKLQPARLAGFDPSSFLPTVWELIPYSFLIDYFTNVGEIVEGWSQIGLKLAWCNRTVRQTRYKASNSMSDLAYCRQVNPFVTYQSMTFAPSDCVIEKTQVTRAEFTGFRIPALSFSLPGSGSLRWLNIAALIAGRRDDRNWFYGN